MSRRAEVTEASTPAGVDAVRRCAEGHHPGSEEASEEASSGGGFGQAGNRAISRVLGPAVGSPDDPLEREADRAADLVMSMATSEPAAPAEGRPAPPAAPAAPATAAVQPRCDCEDEVEEDTPADSEDLVARLGVRAAGAAGAPPDDPAEAAAGVASVRAGGAPLPEPVRAEMEARFGRGFGQVRVHADATAAAAARGIHAHAFTVGSHIAFGAGRWAPATAPGGWLLAHELAHVVQQGEAGPPGAPQRVRRQQDGPAAGGSLTIEVRFKGEPIVYAVELDATTLGVLRDQPALADEVRRLLGELYEPPAGPVHETREFLESEAVRDRLRRALEETARTGAATVGPLAADLAQRQALRQSQALLAGLEAWLRAQGTDPDRLDWRALLPTLRGAGARPDVTAVDHSRLLRYELFLDALQAEAERRPPVAGADRPDPGPLRDTLVQYLFGVLTPQSFQPGTPESFGEAFLDVWLDQVAAVRYVPEGFSLEAFRPENRSEQIARERRRVVDAFVAREATGLMVMFILDEWTRSGQAPEQFLGGLDVGAFRERLLDHLADRLLAEIAQDPELARLLRVQSVETSRFMTLRAIHGAGQAMERDNAALVQALRTAPMATLTPEQRAVAQDPFTYYALCANVAWATRTLLGNVQPDGTVPESALAFAGGLLSSQVVPGPWAALVVTAELLFYIGSLRSLVEEQRRLAREAVRDGLAVDFDRVAEVVRGQAQLADRFIRERWIPMLKQVALERVTQNRNELQQIYDNWDVSNQELILRLGEGAAELERLAQRLEEGSYESLEMDGQMVLPADAPRLRAAAQFMRDEAAMRRDPERTKEKKERLKEAIDGYEKVKADIGSDQFDPLDYSKPVYEEARRRLGISEFPELTTVGMVLRGDAAAAQNPFLARTIVAWHWREGAERAVETGLLLAGLGILTLAAMLVPGVGGLALGALDVAVGIGMGAQQVVDAYEILRMARLDPHQDIRGIGVDEAEQAMRHAWIGLGVTVLLTVGPVALSRALRVRGAGGLELPPEAVAWEEGVSEETRALLRRDPGLRQLFVEMDPVVRWVLTRCGSLCIPPGATAAEVSRIQTLIMRTRGLEQADQWLLREYFYARRAGLADAVTEVEKAGSINKLRKILRQSASERALAAPGPADIATLREPGESVAVTGDWGNPEWQQGYGHSVDEHGAERPPTDLANRAAGKVRDARTGARGVPQGQWYDNSFVVEAERRAPLGQGEHEVDMQRPVGRVYMPDGTVVSDVTTALVIRRADGTVRTSYPYVAAP